MPGGVWRPAALFFSLSGVAHGLPLGLGAGVAQGSEGRREGEAVGPEDAAVEGEEAVVGF